MQDYKKTGGSKRRANGEGCLEKIRRKRKRWDVKKKGQKQQEEEEKQICKTSTTKNLP